MFGNLNPFPLSDKFLNSIQQRGKRRDFMNARATRDHAFECYDFNVKAIDTTNQWTVGATSTATTWAILAEAGGWIRGVTGASVATGALQLSIPQKYWNGTVGAGFASLIRLSAVTTVRLEMGFADVLPAVGTTVVNSLVSHTFNSVVSTATYVYDHAGSTTTTGLYTLGTSSAGASVQTTTNRFDSSATMFVAMELSGRNVNLWLGDGYNPVAKATAAITAADGMFPYIAIKTAAGSRNVDVDTIWTWTLDRT